jgi:tetratricopeptide (TPR) repeat protein
MLNTFKLKIMFFLLLGIICVFFLIYCVPSGTFSESPPRTQSGKPAQTPSSIEDFFQQGIKYFKNFEYNPAKQNFDKVLAASPRDQKALFYRGRCLVEMNHLIQALEDFNKILEINSQNAQGIAGGAEVMLEKKNYHEAMRRVEKAIALDQNLAYAWYLKGMIFGYQNSLDKAIEALKTCLDKDGKYAYAHYQLGLAYNQKGLPDLAASHLEIFLELALNAPEADKVRNLLNRIRHPEEIF